MNLRQVNKLKHGFYQIYWKSGGSSFAAVGSDFYGRRWMAPINWITLPEVKGEHDHCAKYWRQARMALKIPATRTEP